MKSSFFGFSVKLALMLVAVCGIFASCYEKEEIDAAAPSTEAAKYIVKGVVTDEAGTALAGVAVNSAVTKADGTYELNTSVGMQTITISKAGYKTVVTSINVVAIENGNTAVYTVNAALYPIAEEPVYKTNQYNIEGSVFDESGAAIPLTDGSVKIPALTVTVSANTFKSVDNETNNNIEPGSYSAIIKVAGYKTGNATIIISDAGQVVGTGINIVTSKVQVVLQKEDKKDPAIYKIEGNVWNEKGVLVNDADIRINLNDAANTLLTHKYSNGYYSCDVRPDLVSPTTVATVRITKNGYYPYACSFSIKMIAEGETSIVSINASLKSIGTVEGDDSMGGNTSVDIVGKGETVSKTDSEVNALSGTDSEGGFIKVAQLLASMKESTGEEVKAKNMAVTTAPATGISVDLRSDIVQGSEIVAEIDHIAIQPNTQVIYTQGSEGTATVAENISVSRDVAAEIATASIRTYTGTPSGVIFATPLKVTFGSPVDTPDFLLGVMYYNEKTGAWVADKTNGKRNYAKFVGKNFVGNISHFSKFRFGCESTIGLPTFALLAKYFIDKPCYTGSVAQTVTINGYYQGGSMYADGTPLQVANIKLAGMKTPTITYVANMIAKMIKADNLNVAPANDYTKTNFSLDKVIPAYSQVKGFDLTRTEQTKTYSVKVIKADTSEVEVAVKVKTIISYELAVVAEPNHGHGHGHGSDLNAGGGIIDFE